MSKSLYTVPASKQNKTVRGVVSDRLKVLQRKETERPGSIKATPMFWAFLNGLTAQRA